MLWLHKNSVDIRSRLYIHSNWRSDQIYVSCACLAPVQCQADSFVPLTSKDLWSSKHVVTSDCQGCATKPKDSMTQVCVPVTYIRPTYGGTSGESLRRIRVYRDCIARWVLCFIDQIATKASRGQVVAHHFAPKNARWPQTPSHSSSYQSALIALHDGSDDPENQHANSPINSPHKCIRSQKPHRPHQQPIHRAS